MIQMFSAQKSANVIALEIERPAIVVSPPTFANAGHRATAKVLIAAPPIEHWMPNQPHATIARRTAATFAPAVPNEARATTGKGMPYFVPACALSRIGTSTITLPSRIVRSACHQFIPTAMSPPAIMYVGMQCAMEIHSAAKLYVLHVRSVSGTGARSGLKSGLSTMSRGRLTGVRGCESCGGTHRV